MITNTETIYDVVICGAGLAGLTLARQLKLKYPGLTIVMIDKSTFPVRLTTWKVGESSVEASGYYFCHVLQLHDYFKNQHYKKLGLRMFTGGGGLKMEDRPEVGLAAFPSFDSYVYDRGVFENDLYRLNKRSGVDFIEDVALHNAELGDDEAHTISYRKRGEKEIQQVRARWMIDAMGRKRYLQKKLKLTVPPERKHSAVWFRVAGRFDVGDLVPAEREDWHFRVPNGIRYYSVNHLLGKGYWIWIIPLATGHTSVGVVVSEELHGFGEIDSFPRVQNWLQTNEPELGRYLDNFQLLDFMKMRNYSYSSTQVFSSKRWGCTGDAAVFPDPYYSPGGNFIGFCNNMLTEMIGRDLEGRELEPLVERCNRYVISQNEWLTRTLQSSYVFFHKPQIMSLSFLWDVCGGWNFVVPNFFHGMLLDEEKNEILQGAVRSYIPLAINMSKLFVFWAERGGSNKTFTHLNYLGMPFVKAIYDRNLQVGKSPEELAEDLPRNLRDMEDLARVIFYLAVEELFPEEVSRLPETLAVDPHALVLDPSRWQEDGLFSAGGDVDLRPLYAEIKSIYRSASKWVTETKQPDEAFNFSF